MIITQTENIFFSTQQGRDAMLKPMDTFYIWLDSSHDSRTRENEVMRLIFWLTPPDSTVKKNKGV